MNKKLIVNHIIQELNGISRVTLGNELYMDVTGFKSTFKPFSISKNAEATEIISKFNLDGGIVLTYIRNVKSGHQTFFVNSEKAKEHQLTISEQDTQRIANLPVEKEFNTEGFDMTVKTKNKETGELEEVSLVA